MVRTPKDCGGDAWKRWLGQGFKLFDRTWAGWILPWWLFSLVVVLAVEKFGNMFGVLLLVGISPFAFGAHIAVYDALASGKIGPKAWVPAIFRDIATHYQSYAKSGLVRVLVAAFFLFVLTLLSIGIIFVAPEAENTQPPEISFLSIWSVWGWIWLIPAGWQRAGVLGWGHWLIRKEGLSVSIAEKITRLGIAQNVKSYAITAGALMAPVIILMIVFPPLLPVWDLYVAAVCWCVWDDVFGNGDGLKEIQKVKISVAKSTLSGV